MKFLYCIDFCRGSRLNSWNSCQRSPRALFKVKIEQLIGRSNCKYLEACAEDKCLWNLTVVVQSTDEDASRFWANNSDALERWQNCDAWFTFCFICNCLPKKETCTSYNLLSCSAKHVQPEISCRECRTRSTQKSVRASKGLGAYFQLHLGQESNWESRPTSWN